ncbi:MAG: serine/threonine-protein kinase [Gemmatimonadota bacterium]
MTDRWQEVEALFHSALEQRPQERRRWLEEACPDVEVRSEVEALLASEEAAGGGTFIDGAVRVAAGALEQEEGSSRAGQRFGAWRLIEEIGRGGMGTVWLAERADDAYSARAALKFVRGAVLTPELERRFRAERQILADLQHPNIARLLDGGVGPDGVPFLAMEYVEGAPFDEYIAAKGASLEERLRLFLTVCDAVQHAHAALVVHRDLKPSNILVDGSGTPKLVDFGIAKLLGEAGDDEVTHAVPLTPAYASPEQVRGERVTVASDVFSLGVVLYELLSGVQPFRSRGDTARDVQSRILDQEPAPPSTAAARTGEVGTFVPPQRLSGDLDRIVMMTLRKEPERRYATVGHLADDIRRHLEGRPIAARPATVGYRLHKFVSRNRAAVVASVAALLFVTGLIAFYTLRLARERDVAQQERATAEQTVAFLARMFDQAGPGNALGDSVTVRAALDRGRVRLGNELEEQPLVRARLLNAIGRTYLSLGAFATADSLLMEALDLQEPKDGVTASAATADVLDNLALLEARRDGYDAGIAYGERAVAIREQAGDPLLLAKSLVNLAYLLSSTSADSAVALLDRALALQEPTLGLESTELADTRYAQAVALLRGGRYPEGIAAMRRVQAVREARLPPNHPDRSSVLNALAIAYGQSGEPDSALVLFEQALQGQLAVFGPEHPEVALGLANLATAIQSKLGVDTAVALLNRALEIRTGVFGEWSADVGNTLMTIGNAYNTSGETERAIPYYEQAIAIYDSVLPPGHRAMAFPLYNLGVTLNDLDRFAEARPYLERAVEIAERVLGPDHPSTAIDLQALGVAVRALGDTTEAVRLFEDSIERFGRGAPEHPWVAYPVESLIATRRRRGEFEDVERLSRSHWSAIERIYASDPGGLANALETRAEAVRALGRSVEADSLQARARALRTGS